MDQKNSHWRYRELQLTEIKAYALDDETYKLHMYFNSEKLEKVNIHVPIQTMKYKNNVPIQTTCIISIVQHQISNR